jgi:hypothetical protein
VHGDRLTRRTFDKSRGGAGRHASAVAVTTERPSM